MWYKRLSDTAYSISNLSFMTDSHPSIGDLHTGNCLEFVLAPLTGVLWKSIQYKDQCGRYSYKTLVICHIISHSQNIATLISFSVSVRHHHKFASLYLIDTLRGLDHSAPYDEVRCFLTSSAKKLRGSIYIPWGLCIIFNIVLCICSLIIDIYFL